MAYDKNFARKFTVYSNNLVSLGGTYVGRIDRSSYQTSTGARGKTTFYTASINRVASGYDVPHEIDTPLYVGGPADWDFNEEFISQVEAIVSQ